MNKLLVIIFFLSMTMTSCSVVEGIFKAGVGVGVFIVIAIIIIIAIIVRKINK